MNPEPMNRRDADALDAQALDAEALDAFWDELVLGQLAGRAPRAAASPNEEMVMNLQTLMSSGDGGAEARLRRLVFGSAPEPALATATAGSVNTVRPMPQPRPEPIRPGWSIRSYSSLAAAALIVVLVGALVAAQSTGIFGSWGGNDAPTAIPAAIAQIDATPAALGTPTVNDSAILWTLPFDGTNVEIGASAVADGTLYRLIRSDEFTGVQAVDTATGAEKWRSAQEWTGSSIAAGEGGVALVTGSSVTELDSASGTVAWTQELDITPTSLTRTDDQLYVWDGIGTMVALGATDGNVAWENNSQGSTLYEGRTPATQAPVASDIGVAAMSGNRAIFFFDTAGNWITNLGNFDPATVEMALADPNTLIFSGSGKVGSEAPVGPYDRQLVSVDLSSGNVNWQTDYNTLLNGLAVTGSMAMVLTDRLGAPTTQEDIVVDGITLTVNVPESSEQSNSYISGYFLDTGEMYQLPEGTPPPNWVGRAWIADPGIPPFVALAPGTDGPIGISDSGRLSFFNTEDPLVQAVVDLPGLIPTSVKSDGPNVYASEEDGTLVAVAPQLSSLEPHPITASGMIDWSMPSAGTLLDFGGMAYGDGLVFRLIDTGAGQQIEATYALTGQLAWTLPFDWSTHQLVADPGPDPNDPAQTWTGSGNIFAVDTENRLIALNGTSGELSWQHAFANPVVSMVYDTDTLYVWDESGTMTALLPQDGMVLWATTPGNASGPQSNELGMPVPVTTRTTIAMVDADGTLNAFSKETGELLWSTPGFDGTNSRITRQGNAEWDQTEVFVVVSARGQERDDGTFDQSVSGVLAQTGERIWDSSMQGPLVQPSNTDETLVVVTANQLLTGKNVPTDSTPMVDGESFNHYEWTGTGEAAPAGGGQRLFALQADTGEIVWIRSTAAGGFIDLGTKFPGGGGWLYAVTSDGLLVSPNRGNGAIDGEPTNLGGSVLAVISSGESGAIGSFATLADGTLVSFGGMPFSQQG